MEIGEIESSDLNDLLLREYNLKKRLDKYCRQHNKYLSSQFFISKNMFIIKFKIWEQTKN